MPSWIVLKRKGWEMGQRLRRFEFVIPGPLQGYRQTTVKTIWHPAEREKSRSYGRFKESVRLLALEAGFWAPYLGRADRERSPFLSVYLFWQKEPRIDWKNVYGAVEDALWYERQGDRYVVPGRHSGVSWASQKEEALVVVEFDFKKSKVS